MPSSGKRGNSIWHHTNIITPSVFSSVRDSNRCSRDKTPISRQRQGSSARRCSEAGSEAEGL
jgi:hypothetical protein